MLKKNKLSVIVLAYVFDKRLQQLTKDCLDSLQGQADEIILVNNGSILPIVGEYTKRIDLPENIGYPRGLNVGLSACRGDYVVFASNDAKVVKGRLRDMMCDHMTFPKVNWCAENWKKVESTWSDIHGGFFGHPNSDFFRHDERFEIYYSDVDVFERAKRAKIELEVIPSVEIYHVRSATVKKNNQRETIYLKDELKFRDKWGFDYD